MKRHWKITTRYEKRGRWAALFASMNPKGEIMLTRFSWERLGEPEAFLLMYDSINSTIGLQPAKLGEENAFPAASHGTARGKVIYGFQMVQEFGILLDGPLRFCNIEINEDGVMLLDLKTARPVHRAKRTEPLPFRANSHDPSE